LKKFEVLLFTAGDAATFDNVSSVRSDNDGRGFLGAGFGSKASSKPPRSCGDVSFSSSYCVCAADGPSNDLLSPALLGLVLKVDGLAVLSVTGGRDAAFAGCEYELS
jgi:hypothetical protein